MRAGRVERIETGVVMPRRSGFDGVAKHLKSQDNGRDQEG